MTPIDQSVLVGLAGLTAGLLTRLLTDKQKKFELKHDEAQSIRKELRVDVSHLETKIEKIMSDLDHWKDKYYKLADENIALRSRCKALEIEVEALQETMKRQPNPEPSAPLESCDTQKQ